LAEHNDLRAAASEGERGEWPDGGDATREQCVESTTPDEGELAVAGRWHDPRVILLTAGAVRVLPLSGTIGDWSITLEQRPTRPGENPNGD